MEEIEDIVVRLRLEEPSDELLATAADEIEVLRDVAGMAMADRQEALRRLEETVRILIWIANGGEGAGEDGLRYVAAMAVTEAGA